MLRKKGLLGRPSEGWSTNAWSTNPRLVNQEALVDEEAVVDQTLGIFAEKTRQGCKNQDIKRYHRDLNISSQIMWYLMSNQIVDTSSDEFWMVVRKRPANMSVQVQNENGVDVEKLKMTGLTADAVRFLKKDLLGRYNYLTEAQGRKEVDGSFLVGGFVLPLQILAYEYYPSMAKKFARRRDVDGLMLPRMFQWVTNTWPSNRAPTTVDVTAAFDDCAIDDCLGCLTPTPEELVSVYYTTGDFVDSAPDVVTTRVLELWRQGQTVICSEHPLDSPSVQHMHFAHSTPSVQHTPSAHASPDVSGTRPGDLNRSSSSTSSPMRTGPRVHFGLNLSRRPSPLEYRFEWRLTALEDSVTSMHVKISAEFIETRASVRSINQAIVDLKSSFNLGLDELRLSLTDQITAGFAEMRSNMLSAAGQRL
ncbi:uncharacterized protein LOC142541826 [Primulina tabacum]|uniref:uncharacterized protein LOC142541826 n=1 Tax=Primulina tabacum TaxID=48773 RepID=UPI003F598B6F